MRSGKRHAPNDRSTGLITVTSQERTQEMFRTLHLDPMFVRMRMLESDRETCQGTLDGFCLSQGSSRDHNVFGPVGLDW